MKSALVEESKLKLISAENVLNKWNSRLQGSCNDAGTTVLGCRE